MTAYRRTVLIFALLALVAAGSSSRAQVPDPLVATQAPVAGAGHHYIGLGAETVNPADGSLSFDLPIKTPDGRELSFPFGIRYSSSEELYLASMGSQFYGWYSHSPNLTNTNGIQIGVNGSPAPNQVGAWSYDLPLVTSESLMDRQGQMQAEGQQGSCGQSGPCPYYSWYCDAWDNFVFRGLDGEQFSLPIGMGYLDTADTSNQLTSSQLAGICNNGSSSVVTPGNNHGILSSFQNIVNNIASGLTVVDHAGTTYQFPAGGGSTPTLSTAR